jgi:hypothetical protein
MGVAAVRSDGWRGSQRPVQSGGGQELQRRHDWLWGSDWWRRVCQAARCTPPRLDWAHFLGSLTSVGGALAGACDHSLVSPIRFRILAQLIVRWSNVC